MPQINQNSRMQVLKSSQSMLSTMSGFAARDGIPSLWAGLSASMLRQGTYSTTRFGLHSYISNAALSRSGRDSLPLTWNIACAGVSGGVAGLIGNPTEVVLVRMCADGAKSQADRFNYSNAVSGLIKVCRDEGLGAFSKGLGPNVVRSVLMSKSCFAPTATSCVLTRLDVSQIATYSSAKGFVLKSIRSKDDVTTHTLASLAAGTVATTVCAPADVLKSRIQSSAGGEVSSSTSQQLSHSNH